MPRLESRSLSTATAGGSRTTTVFVRATSASLGGGKVLGDLQWRRSDLANWSAITSTDVQVEQRVMAKNGANDPWGNTIFFRMLLSWITDAPAAYTANYVVTLSQTSVIALCSRVAPFVLALAGAVSSAAAQSNLPAAPSSEPRPASRRPAAGQELTPPEISKSACRQSPRPAPHAPIRWCRFRSLTHLLTQRMSSWRLSPTGIS